jgi:uncharacterized protein (TIGR02118 family)
MKLVALYKQPEDASVFDKAYFDTHMPLIEKVPGLKSTAITRFTRTVAGEQGWYLMAEMDFSDEETLKTAMRSPEMAAAGENLNSFAEGMYTLLFAQSE